MAAAVYSLLLFLVSWNFDSSAGIFQFQPEQIHLSYGRDETQMILTWSTRNNTDSSLIRYGRSMDKMNQEVNGTRTYFNDGGPHQLTQYFHRAVMIGLTPGETYYYICGSKYGWSDLYKFNAMPKGDNWSPRLVMFGDMGSVNAKSLPWLQEEMPMYDAILHIGDFAYDMDSNESTVGDNFMNQIQSIAAHRPYMTCPGNHEVQKQFKNYRHRFTMPGDENGDNMFYSFDIGPAHIISISTENYYFFDEMFFGLFKQLDWLENDLKKANLPENRAKRPWIIVFGHRPMYCSNNDTDDCTKHETRVRVGIPYLHALGLEDKFDKYGVDLALWAHEHSYERLWPVYNRKVFNGSYDKPYTNPRAPVHVITGSAGCKEIKTPFYRNPSPWSAFRSDDYGYSRMTVHNHTHLSIDQVSVEKGGKVIDSFTMVKDKHEPYGLGNSGQR